MEQEIMQRAAELRQQHLLPGGTLPAVIQELLDYLPDCEYELIKFMVQKNCWQGFIPPPPNNFKPDDGTVELGLFLYWLNNQYLIDLSMFTFKEQVEIRALILLVSEELASTQMTDINANFFKTNELIYSDGETLSMKKYATYDQGWLIAFFNLVQSMLNNLWYYGENLPNNIPPVVQLSDNNTGMIRVAVLGDCGTGDTVLQQMMQSIEQQKPDYIIHVGDVYYAGTPLAGSKNGSYYFYPGEEVNNLLKFWPASYKGRSFTLNSNHEMYSGANGYFDDALDAGNKGANSIFSAQAGSSFFFLQCADWLLIGLDTAYQSSTSNAFMDGTIGGANSMQATWIKKINRNPSQTILFTHHNGIEADCSDVCSLWAEINGAFGADPYAWYWGHVHNGIVYNSPLTVPSTGPAKLTTNTYARCLGHAALPYGLASSLLNKPIKWNEANKQPAPSQQLYNGYAILTFYISHNSVMRIQEDFYDISGPNSLFRNIIFSK